MGYGRLAGATSGDGTAVEASFSGGLDENGILDADFLGV